MGLEEFKDKDADPNCEACHGFGMVNIGSICTGFGGKPEYVDCMCKVYKKIGIGKK